MCVSLVFPGKPCTDVYVHGQFNNCKCFQGHLEARKIVTELNVFYPESRIIKALTSPTKNFEILHRVIVCW